MRVSFRILLWAQNFALGRLGLGSVRFHRCRTRAIRLAKVGTMISDQFDQPVIEIDPSGSIVFSQGKMGAAGNGFNELNAPYDAKVVVNSTALTPPF